MADRDVQDMRAAFDAWYASMPAGWQDSYTIQGRLLVAYTHGWDDRLAHDARNRPITHEEILAACPDVERWLSEDGL